MPDQRPATCHPRNHQRACSSVTALGTAIGLRLGTARFNLTVDNRLYALQPGVQRFLGRQFEECDADPLEPVRNEPLDGLARSLEVPDKQRDSHG